MKPSRTRRRPRRARPDACALSLAEPVFIDGRLIADGSHPNDSKLYFFFRERLTDNSGRTRSIRSMVARVCPVRLRPRAANPPAAPSPLSPARPQNDVGGQRSLVNKWTTFLKARLVCSVLEGDGTETHFDELGEWPRLRRVRLLASELLRLLPSLLREHLPAGGRAAQSAAALRRLHVHQVGR